MSETWKTIVRDALIVSMISALGALGFNALRPRGIPLIASVGYDIFVPCPEPLGEIEALSPSAPELLAAGTQLIDARSHPDFQTWHAPSARNVVFDYLEATSEDTVREIIRTGAQRVVVYGDGDDPDTGHELGRELAGKGMRNIWFVAGGASALRSCLEDVSAPGKPGGLR
jgi:hypothetical protein